MTLTVGVDTYGNLADLEAVLIGLGFVEYLDANDDPTLEAHARSACLFLDHAYAWCGVRAVPGQALAWPRSGALDIDGFEIPDDVVPNEVVTAQALLMQACSAGPLEGAAGARARIARSSPKQLMTPRSHTHRAPASGNSRWSAP
jgi:Putative DnaT-like ssDNA binding protein